MLLLLAHAFNPISLLVTLLIIVLVIACAWWIISLAPAPMQRYLRIAVVVIGIIVLIYYLLPYSGLR